MAQDRSALLQQLSLDKAKMAATPAGHTSKWPLVGWVLFSLVLGFTLAWLVLPRLHPAMQDASRSEVPDSVPSSMAAPTPTNNKPEISKVLDASGYVTARRVATVSAEVMGLLLSVDVEEGMSVEEGQVLAQIDDSVAQIQLRLARAKVETQLARVQGLQVDLAEAERELQRLNDLGGAGDYASKAQLSQAQTTVDRLKANIRSAEADLDMTHLQVERQQDLVDDHVIRAPFAGVVTAKNAQAGEIVSPSSAGGGFTRTGICTIVDMDSLEIEVDVNEAFIGRVHNTQTVVAMLDAYPNWIIPAQVIAVIPTADRSKATVRVRIQILEKDPKILPDMGVNVSFLAEEAEPHE